MFVVSYECFKLSQYNPVYEAVISVDKQGMLNYWTGAKDEYEFPKNVNFESKLDTDLFEFMKQKTYPVSLCFSPNGEQFATYAADRKVERISKHSCAVMVNNFLFTDPYI